MLASGAGVLALVMAVALILGAANRLAALGLLAATCGRLWPSRGYQLHHAALLIAIIGLLQPGRRRICTRYGPWTNALLSAAVRAIPPAPRAAPPAAEAAG